MDYVKPEDARNLPGLRLALTESAFRQELALACVLAPLALWVDVAPAERALLISSVLLVLVVELLNSAVEAAVDRISLEDHELAKRAKDTRETSPSTQIPVSFTSPVFG